MTARTIEKVETTRVTQLTKGEFTGLNTAIQRRAFEQELHRRSWVWRLRNWRRIRALRQALMFDKLDWAVNKAMQRAGLNPEKTYTLDAKAFTASEPVSEQ